MERYHLLVAHVIFTCGSAPWHIYLRLAPDEPAVPTGLQKWENLARNAPQASSCPRRAKRWWTCRWLSALTLGSGVHHLNPTQ